ncbi:MAG: hypothetical protein RI953_92 [Pseudomonadota bacterium]|jgi:hypothetical protein
MNQVGVFRLQMERSKRSTLSLVLTGFLFLGLIFGCGRSERPAIGQRLDSPMALASHPNLSAYYVLNASLGGEFKTGSLQLYSVPTTSSDSSSPVATLETPRLGTALAVAKEGSFLIAGFSGSVGELRIYDLDARGVPTASSNASDAVVLPTGRVGSIQINPIDGQTDSWTVVVTLADRSLDAKVLLFKYSRTLGFAPLAQIPADFYTPSRENDLGYYVMTWGAPVVFPAQGIMVAFPQGVSGYFGKNPSALDWLQGKVQLPNAAFDLRTVSAAVVDLRALVGGKSFSDSLGFLPIAFNAAGQKANPSAASDSLGNADYQFSRAGFQSSISLDPANLPCALTGSLANLPQATAVVTTNTETADVIAFSGWDLVANQLRNQLSANEKQPILKGNLLTPSPVSMTSGIAALSGVRTLVPSLQVINAGSVCTLSWLRVDQFRSSLGRESSRIQIATDSNSANQLSRDYDLAGMASFTVSGQSILAGSFSNNKIQVLRLNGMALDNVGVFQP